MGGNSGAPFLYDSQRDEGRQGREQSVVRLCRSGQDALAVGGEGAVVGTQSLLRQYNQGKFSDSHAGIVTLSRATSSDVVLQSSDTQCLCW